LATVLWLWRSIPESVLAAGQPRLWKRVVIHLRRGMRFRHLASYVPQCRVGENDEETERDEGESLIAELATQLQED
jgi:hypothetical protein